MSSFISFCLHTHYIFRNICRGPTSSGHTLNEIIQKTYQPYPKTQKHTYLKKETNSRVNKFIKKTSDIYTSRTRCVNKMFLTEIFFYVFIE